MGAIGVRGLMETQSNNLGWILLHRSIMNTPEWLSEPVTRAQAWVDLLLLANHKTSHIRKRGILVAIQRGGIGYGEEALAARWKWSRGKVRRYLAWLESEKRIERRISEKTVPKKTSVSHYIYITNYEKYQFDGTEDGTEDGRKTVQEQRIKGMKGKKPKPSRETDPAFLSFYSAYPKKRNKPSALKVWAELSPSKDKAAEIMCGLQRAKTSAEWVRDNGRYIPQPANWLKAEGWQDDYTAGGSEGQQGGKSETDNRQYDFADVEG